jgi:hypothetical protein
MKSLTEKTLDKAQTLYDTNMTFLDPLPNPDEFGYVKIKYQELQRLIKQRTQIAWSNGACFMLASVNIDRDNGK